jgi:hypothetical protein
VYSECSAVHRVSFFITCAQSAAEAAAADASPVVSPTSGAIFSTARIAALWMGFNGYMTTDGGGYTMGDGGRYTIRDGGRYRQDPSQ